MNKRDIDSWDTQKPKPMDMFDFVLAASLPNQLKTEKWFLVSGWLRHWLTSPWYFPCLRSRAWLDGDTCWEKLSLVLLDVELVVVVELGFKVDKTRILRERLSASCCHQYLFCASSGEVVLRKCQPLVWNYLSTIKFREWLVDFLCLPSFLNL